MLRRPSAVRPLPLLVLVALLAPVGCAAAQRRESPVAEPRQSSAPIADVRYDVTFDAASALARTLRVEMSFTVAGRDPVLLSLPAWTPGAYEITGFARWLSGFAAAGADGRSLQWDKVDPDTWRVRPDARGRVTVRFDYLADTLDNAMSWTRPDFALFNGTNLFFYAEGRGFDVGATVVVHTTGGWQVATGMEQTASATSTAGAGTVATTYTARNYHDLVDMPFFVGRFDIDSVSVALPGAQGSRWVRLATYPAGSVSGARRAAALRWLERVVPPEAAVFGETPWRTYTVMQIADSTYGGASGLEHQNSHVDVVTPLALDSPILPSLYAHEIFHAWNVKRLRPADLVPYRYDQPQPTPLLWWSEGVTDYYADLAESRGGLVDSSGFLELVDGKIEEVAAAPPIALEDASLSTWIHPTDGTDYIYYPKGSLVGLLLDVIVRDASDNRRSLDDVMRELYATTYAKGSGFTNEQLWDALARAAGGRRLDDFYRRYVDGREELPYAGVLPLAGFRYVADTTQEPRLGVGSTADSTGALVVTYVDPQGALAAAGVQTGDELVSIGEVPVSDQSFGARFRAKYARSAAGSRLPVSVRREGRVLSLNARLAFAPKVARHVRIDPTASAKAVRIRNGILRASGEGR